MAADRDTPFRRLLDRGPVEARNGKDTGFLAITRPIVRPGQCIEEAVIWGCVLTKKEQSHLDSMPNRGSGYEISGEGTNGKVESTRVYVLQQAAPQNEGLPPALVILSSRVPLRAFPWCGGGSDDYSLVTVGVMLFQL